MANSVPWPPASPQMYFQDENGLYHANPFLRVKGRDKSAFAALGQGLRNRVGQRVVDRRPARPTEDYTQVDLTLTVTIPGRHLSIPAPQVGVSYAGMTPAQRHWFLFWLCSPDSPGPPAFRTLYVAYLEIALFETAESAKQARKEIARLLGCPGWHDHTGLQRAWLLGAWLAEDGPGVAAWPAEAQPGEEALLTGLGLQAQMGIPLQPQQSLAVMDVLGLTPDGGDATPEPEVMKHRLGSLAATLGGETLAHCLAQLPPEEMRPQPWRCSHRDLRFALPQPNIVPLLRPLLQELAAQDPGDNGTRPTFDPDDGPGPSNAKWSLTLEFQESRSQYFAYALTLAKKQPSFSQIMDENRHMVYRVNYSKSQLRHLWPLWEYVSKWTNTQIYVNGKSVPTWQVWPSSQYLR